VQKSPSQISIAKRTLAGGNNKLAAILDANPKFKSTYEWAARAVHPCDERRTGALPIPDATNRTTACPEYRYDDTFSAPPSYTRDGTTILLTNKWDCAIISPDMVECAAILFMKPNGVTWADWNGTLGNDYPGNAAWAFKALRFDQFPEGSGIADVAESWRVSHRGITMHLDAADINNTGMVYSQQWPETWEVVNNKVPVTGGVTFGRVISKVGPWEPKDQTQRSGATYETNAFNGVYNIQYPDQQTGMIQYKGQEDWIVQDSDKPANSGLTNSLAGGGVWYPTPNNATLETTPAHGLGVQTFGYKGGFTAGLIYFEGMPGAGNGVAPAANLVLKVRQGVELVPRPDSPLAPFSVSPVPFNPGALEFVTHVSQSAAMAYPADYNDLSKIWGAIKKGMKEYGMPLVQGVADAGIPVISDVARIGQGIASFFGF